MKKIVLSLASFMFVVSAYGQLRFASPDNSSMLIYPLRDTRTEIIVPNVNGYRVIKADLHIHTTYSDGKIAPDYRITEAWMDGLDAVSITDHLEYRPCEKKMIKFLGGNVTQNEKVKDEIRSDMNFSTSQAKSLARHRGITLIPGAEITRKAQTVGHFNVLFTTDNNAIYDPDPIQSLRNARKQGAIIQINHPGWRKTDNEYTSVMNAAIGEGLIDGVEIFNSEEFYPDVIEKAVDKNFFVAGGTDIHEGSNLKFTNYGIFRNMTLILAKDSSAEAIREALENGRTIAYGYGDFAGSRELLTDFMQAAISVKLMNVGSTGNKYLRVVNNTSFPFILYNPESKKYFILKALSSISTSTKDDCQVYRVDNLWCG